MQLVPTSARSTNSTSGFTYPHAPPPHHHHQHPHAFFLDQDVARIKSEKYIQDLDSKPVSLPQLIISRSNCLPNDTHVLAC